MLIKINIAYFAYIFIVDDVHITRSQLSLG